MDIKSKFTNKTTLPHFLVGLLYITGITLAVFTYGEFKLIKNKTTSESKTNWEEVYVADAPKEIKEIQLPKPSQPQTPKVLDLNRDIKPVVDTVTTTKEIVDTTTTTTTTMGDSLVISKDTTDRILLDKVTDFPDVEAKFPGGFEAWRKFLLDELVYPEIAIEMGDCGIVYVSFIIERDGRVSNVTVRRGVSRSIDEEAKRVVEASPKWIPGQVNNKNVRTSTTLMITFEIQ